MADLISTLSGGIGGLGEGESHNPEMIDRFLDPDKFQSVEDLLRGNEDPQRPKAYLNYILYEENMEIVRTFTGSFQANGNGGWQTIGTQAPLELPSNGYLAVYLSNQSKPSGCEVCGDVYFDDFELEISTGKLKEETHYYPFGLPMANAGAAADGLEPNRHKYRGNEYVKDAGLNWMDFNFRLYACTELVEVTLRLVVSWV